MAMPLGSDMSVLMNSVAPVPSLFALMIAGVGLRLDQNRYLKESKKVIISCQKVNLSVTWLGKKQNVTDVTG